MKIRPKKITALALSALMLAAPVLDVIPAFAKTKDLVIDSAKEAATQETALTITNNTNMFKAVSAKLVKEEDTTYLVMALSGSGYRELYLGTYEKAVANGDGTKDKGNDSWIHGYLNNDSKYEFKIPLTDDMLSGKSVAVTAISNSYYEKYLNGTNDLARIFYPRQFQIDVEKATLTTGDYDASVDVKKVTNVVKTLDVASASINTVGGPNSNTYYENLVLNMKSDTYDKLFVGNGKDATAEAEIALTDNKFTLDFKNHLDTETTVSFHDKVKDEWVDTNVTLSKTGLKLSIYPASLKDGTYNVKFDSSLGMFHFDSPVNVVVKGDTATVTIHSVVSKARYDYLFIGKYADLDESKAIEGVADPNKAEDNKSNAYYFTFNLPTSALTSSNPIYYVLRYREGYSAEHSKDWYQSKTGEDYYLTVTQIEEVEKKAEETALTITNNTNMFKAVSAKLVKEEDTTYLVMALSGSGYRELYLGTYEKAVANGDGTKDKGNDSWIHGYLNNDSKYEFKIPLTDDMLSGKSVAVTAISNSYYEKYLNGTNDLARIFYPRQFQIDVEKGTLTTGDYDEKVNVTVTNSTELTGLDITQAFLNTVGGPNSNNYSEKLIIMMADNQYDKAFLGNAKDAAVNGGTALKDGGFELEFKDNFEIKTVVSFHDAAANTWKELNVFFNKGDSRLYIYPAKLTSGKYLIDLTSSLKMFKYDNPVDVVVKGDTATVKIHSVVSNSRYDRMFIGKYANLDESKAIVGEADPGNAEDKSDAYYFTFDIPTTSLTDFTPIYYVLRYREGYSQDHSGDWYQSKSKEDYYLTVTGIKKENTSAVEISEKDVSDILDVVYTGKALKPEVTVTVNGQKLTVEKDYIITYTNNINAGTAKVTIEGIGDYEGSITKTFKIKKASQSITTAFISKKVNATKTTNYSISAKKAQGSLSYKVASTPKKAANFISVNSKGVITLKKGAYEGTYKIKITAKETKNYKSASKIISLKVEKASQKLEIKVKSKKINYSNVKKKNQSFEIGAKAAGKITYKIASTPSKNAGKYISVNKNGKVTLKKNAPKGNYVIKITAKATTIYKQATGLVKVVVK